MKELPGQKFFDGFYIWFDKSKKEEYYATPLYQYNTISSGSFDDGKQSIKLKKSISKFKPSKKTEALKYPAFISFPYYENFGNMLVKFLNADFTDFNTAYDTFFYAYGFELLKDFAPHEAFKGKFDNEVEMLEILKDTFNSAYQELYEAQYDFRQCVNFIYNLKGNDELKDSKPLSKFIASVIKREHDINWYQKEIELILDNYEQKYFDYQSETLESLVKRIDEDKDFVTRNNIYTSPYLFSILFVILERVVSCENISIKECPNCGKYFIPTSRQSEVYCDFENLDASPTCREKGASETYKKNLVSVPGLLEYRRTYQKKIMIASRNKENKQLRVDFDKWKKGAQAKIKLYKQGKLSEDELYKWMIENK